MDPRNFFAELKRRNVYEVAVVYAVVSWLLMQIATQVFPFFEIPNWAIRLVIMLLALGFPIALIFAWAFEPDYGPAISVLGVIDAGLGRKEDALREGRRGVELSPVAKDSINGPLMISNLAIIAAWTGEKDLALEQLRIATQQPGGTPYGILKLNQMWDPLRGRDPRFEEIVTSLAPKETR